MLEYFAVAAAVGYLFGSIPFGLLLTRAAGLGDVRKIGSGNIGTTNVLRTGHKGLAAATLLLDAGKGAVAVLAFDRWGLDFAVVAGLAAVLGHSFPLWLRFRGGKGVATGLGVLIALAWPVGLAACAVWLITAFATRYSSLAALIAFASSPLLALILVAAPDRLLVALAAITVATLVFARHAGNIRRLLRGEESKIGRTSSPPD
ncbi:MAG: glycerol-3-phosphate 1-O-acyltransferase PlsY [Rhodospirillales bacterium]|nr:glycerol-3-phosphate 1-O-acyltransferase PlsY [Rhodospirillales bacterium]